jgi:type I restriction enzyme R subunit
VRLTIDTLLDELPRTYSPDLYHQKCDAVYQHVFESYQGQGRSLYNAVHQGTGTGSAFPSSNRL